MPMTSNLNNEPIEQSRGEIVELATNLDDISPQILGAVRQALFDAGAREVWTTAIDMKKDRPGTCLSVLCHVTDRDRLARLVLTLTGSFGIRYRQWDRLVLTRHYEHVHTAHGEVRLKIGSLPDGEIIVARPEYEDVRMIAEKTGRPLRDVMADADAEAWRWLQQHRGQADTNGE